MNLGAVVTGGMRKPLPETWLRAGREQGGNTLASLLQSSAGVPHADPGLGDGGGGDVVLGVSPLGHRAGRRRAESNGREAGRGQRESPAQKVTVETVFKSAWELLTMLSPLIVLNS